MTDVAVPLDKGRAPLNPVLARELRVRLSSGRTWLLLGGYLLVLAAIVFFVYQAESVTRSLDGFTAPSPTRFASVGRSVFEWLVFFMLLLVLFLVPGLTSGAIAGERDRQTLVPLQVTLLRPWQVVVGKLASSFAFVGLLVVATMPLLSVAYLIGGVTIQTVVKGVAVVLFTGIVLTCLSIGCSAFFRRVQTATVASYGVVLVLVFGTMLAWAAAGVVDDSRGTDTVDPPAALLALNPLFTAADVLDDGERVADLGLGSTPFRFLQERLYDSQYGSGITITNDFGPQPGFARADAAGGVAGVGFGVGPDGRPIIGIDRNGIPIQADDSGFPFWAGSVIALYVLAVASMLFAATRLRTPARTER